MSETLWPLNSFNKYVKVQLCFVNAEIILNSSSVYKYFPFLPNVLIDG